MTAAAAAGIVGIQHLEFIDLDRSWASKAGGAATKVEKNSSTLSFSYLVGDCIRGFSMVNRGAIMQFVGLAAHGLG